MENIPPKPQIHEHSLTRALLIMLLLVPGLLVMAQQQSSPNGKAVKWFDKALDAYQMGDRDKSLEYLSKAIKEDSTYADAWILSGDIYAGNKELERASSAYRRALDLNPDHREIVRELLANTLFDDQRYGEAAGEYRVLLQNPALKTELLKKFDQQYTLAEFRQSLMDHPVAFEPENLGHAVNTSNDEYINSLGLESNRIIFTRKSPLSDDPLQREFEEDFFQSFLSDTGWSQASRFSFSQSTKGDAGGLCLSSDGKLLFFTACFRKDSKGSCDIYYSEKKGNIWSDPKNMGDVVNSDNWDAQPSLSPDGKTLYFASNREGSLGSSDIWATHLNADGAWTKPVNLGTPVNTRSTEMAPFIHFDNETLYFSSDGHRGMGGQDLYVSKRGDSGWSEPLNLGYPVNTLSDELVMVVSPGGKVAYISASLDGGYGGYDIYSFVMEESVRPLAVTYMKGKVFDKETDKPLKAEFQLFDLRNDSLIMEAYSSLEDGTFLVGIPSGRDYAINVARQGYLFYSDHFALEDIREQADPYLKDIPLEPIKVGKVIVMRNIFFETDKYQLKDKSKTELNELLEFLMNNPGVHIEVSGHTDNVGTEAYNLELSKKRAASVVDYLVGAGINPGRLTSAGYAFSRPVASNDTEAGRAENRRTEIKVTGIE